MSRAQLLRGLLKGVPVQRRAAAAGARLHDVPGAQVSLGSSGKRRHTHGRRGRAGQQWYMLSHMVTECWACYDG